MGKIRLILLPLAFLAFISFSEAQNRYAVYFKYKPQSGFTLSNPGEYLSPKALQRRQREGISADSLDLPVAKKYEEEVANKASYLLYSSKWLNASVVIADETQVKSINELPFVEKVELVARGFTPPPSGRLKNYLRVTASSSVNCEVPKLNARITEVEQNQSYQFQNEVIGIDVMHEEGFTGKGITIAVFDAGFPGVNQANGFQGLIANGQIVGQKDFIRPWNPSVFTDHPHGTNVLSLIGANEPGVLVSGAYESEFVLVITEEVATEYRIEEINWVRGAEYADSLGVDIISSSVGYWDFDDPSMNYTLADLDGKTATITKGASIAADRGILVVNSVGNYGSRGTSSLVAPADADGILAIGSVNSNLSVSGFSSRGPTGDGRLKPDLVAYGESPILLRANGTSGAASGTSFSAPQVTALAAGLWQARPEWKKDELIQRLLESASNFETPDNNLGYGIPSFYQAYFGEVLSAEVEEEVLWKVFPNPLSGEELMIYFGNGLESQFELIDLTGKVLIQSKLIRSDIKSPFIVQLSGVKPGLYLVQMSDGLQFKQTKLLKQ
ncbi:S8 family serine peptidase [Algoriphagus taiwanensis]|uniref:S8 family serine peptidase n=1 Tax=Algoriphagus taiwanensis TaxID=1445656 RepID=A0ABQ6PZW5_9BACT|nr:S8 family serine peptidase [Algoriphagus taiwanensis]